MDANGTRFHLVYRQAEWLGEAASPPRAGVDHLQWNASDATISLHTRLFRFPTRKSETPPTQGQRRGVDADRFGNIYVISESRREILYQSRGASTAEHFWSSTDVVDCPVTGAFAPTLTTAAEVLELSGLAVTAQHYLVVGVKNVPGVLVFDLFGGGAPVRLLWPGGVAFEPWDMSPDTDGGVSILDRTNHSLWKLDRTFRVVGFSERAEAPGVMEDFHPAGGAARTRCPEQPVCGISRELAFELPDTNPVAVETLADGTVLVLNDAAAHSIVRRYRGNAAAGEVEIDDDVMHLLEQAEAVHAHDMEFLDGRLYLVASSGNQMFAFAVTLEPARFSLELLGNYYPMRGYGGRGLLIADGSVRYDAGGIWAPIAEQPRPRYEQEATVELGPFDGKEPGCVWHRILFDGCLPADAAVSIETRAAESEDGLEFTEWFREPGPYLRTGGAELPFYRPPFVKEQGRAGTWETLVQHQAARYLQVRLTLRGTGRNSPRIRALRVYYPRFSYLTYLPAIYRDEPVASSFLDRFLANVEGFYTGLEDRIAQAQLYFDVRTVAPEFLEWLAQWMGVSLDLSWSEAKRRLFLTHAMQMFRERGTPAGLRRMLRLALEECVDESLFDVDDCAQRIAPFSVRIVERFLTRSAPGLYYGDPSAATGSAVSLTAWTPAQGAEPLDKLWRDYLQANGGGAGASGMMPAIRPAGALGETWEQFLGSALPFTYETVTENDFALWGAFLQRKYVQPQELNLRYGLSANGALSNFSQAGTKLVQGRWGGSLPRGGHELEDWITFVSVVVPTLRNAHRFRVLVPVNRKDSVATQQRRLELARRVTAEQKPAHTDFDVRLYWAMFRVGESLLGIDTVLGDSPRSSPLTLGVSGLGSSALDLPPSRGRLKLPACLTAETKDEGARL